MGEQHLYYDNGNRQQLSNDDLWCKAGTNEPITRQDINIRASSSNNGLQNLSEGFNLLQADE